MSMLNRRTYTLTTLLSTAACIGHAYIYDNGTSFVSQLVRSKLNILILVNMAYCTLFYFGKLIQLLVFGELREVESQNINDRLLNYILLKIVFVGAVLEPELRELLVWVSWFSILGFMRILSLLARDRFEYIITFSPNAATSTHVRILVLLSVILIFDIVWFYLCVSYLYVAGASIVLLLTFECFTLFLDTIQTLVKYGIHLIDLRRESLWEQRGTYIYYTEFVTDSLVLLATLAHYIQILALNGVSFTLIDVIIFFQMRAVFNNLREKLISYGNYRTLVIALNSGYEEASAEELASLNDDCAICRERMSTAKKLPCGHIFHVSCLRSWLEQHHSCPTCRRSLIDTTDSARRAQLPANDTIPPDANFQRRVGVNFGFPDNRFGFFSFGFQNPAIPPETIRGLRDTFPHVPEHVIAADLARTRSAEQTAENIIEGRLVFTEVRDTRAPVPTTTTGQPPISQNFPPTPLTSSSSNTSMPSSPPTQPPSLASISPTQVPTTPLERQALLEARKQALKEQALKRYLEKRSKSQPHLPEVQLPQPHTSPSTPLLSSRSTPVVSPAVLPNTTTSSSIYNNPPPTTTATTVATSTTTTTATTTSRTTSLNSSSSSIPLNSSASSIPLNSSSSTIVDEPPEVRRKRLIEAVELRLRKSASKEQFEER